MMKGSAYGIIATLYVARQPGEQLVGGPEIARECGLPADFLLTILGRLTHLRILYANRGRRGGFTLAKPPAQITLLEIVEAVEGPSKGDLRFQNEAMTSQRAWKKYEAIRKDIVDYSRSKLSQTTIKQLID